MTIGARGHLVTAAISGILLAGTSTSALAATESVTMSYCSTGRVESIANNLPIRNDARINASLITTAQKGYQYNCQGANYPGYILGDSYTACGVTSNRWTQIMFNSGTYGYAYATCLKDV